MPLPHAELQDRNQTSPLIELFTLDATACGGSIYNFSNEVGLNGNAIQFGGTTYDPIPVQVEGFNYENADKPPKPTVTISNVLAIFLPEVIIRGDLVGATFSRRRTFAKYFDNQPTADPTKFLGPDVFIVEQKTSHNNQAIQWQLTTPIDRLGMRLPRRQILRDKGFPSVSRIRVPG